jgi:hypothetical protein
MIWGHGEGLRLPGRAVDDELACVRSNWLVLWLMRYKFLSGQIESLHGWCYFHFFWYFCSNESGFKVRRAKRWCFKCMTNSSLTNTRCSQSSRNSLWCFKMVYMWFCGETLLNVIVSIPFVYHITLVYGYELCINSALCPLYKHATGMDSSTVPVIIWQTRLFRIFESFSGGITLQDTSAFVGVYSASLGYNVDYTFQPLFCKPAG